MGEELFPTPADPTRGRRITAIFIIVPIRVCVCVSLFFCIILLALALAALAASSLCLQFSSEKFFTFVSNPAFLWKIVSGPEGPCLARRALRARKGPFGPRGQEKIQKESRISN
jgi:hypothetical protein